MTQSKLFRDSYNQVLGGVASGLGNYFNLDPLLVRILFVLLAIFGGGGVIIYILLWIFVPDDQDNTVYGSNKNKDPNPYDTENPESFHPHPQRGNEINKGNLVAGIILITIGSIFLVDRFIPRIYFEDLWPIIFVIIGVVLIFNHFNKEKPTDNEL